jgi:hypothetical protein
MVSSSVRNRHESAGSKETLTPLLVPDLLNRIIPCIACIVDDDMNLTTAELSGLLNQGVDGFVVRDISGNSDRSAPI